MIEVNGAGLTAGGDALIRRQRRIAIDQRNAIERHGQFFGYQLRLGRGHALAELCFAAVGCDFAVGGNGDPGIHLSRRG